MNGLSVVSVTDSNHAILLVSDLDSTDLAQLSRAVSVPLAGRLERNVDARDLSQPALQQIVEAFVATRQ